MLRFTALCRSESTPGEDGLLHLINTGLISCPPLDAHPSELHEYCACRGMDEVVAEGDLNHWAVAFGNIDKTWGVITAERMDADSVHRPNLVR